MSARQKFVSTELRQTLWGFRREFYAVGVFSIISNVLMLTPTLYMLQVYDRVLVSRSELTLLAVSVLALLLLAVMAVAEWLRSRVLVRTSMRIDDMLSSRVFQASFDASLRGDAEHRRRAFSDLTELRQFITGNGIFAFFDAPWAPIYIAVLFLMHPFLGWAALGFCLVQGLLAWWGNRSIMAPTEALQRSHAEESRFLQAQLRNAEAVESMGMLAGLRARWHQRHNKALEQHERVQTHQHRVMAWSKFVRYCQQSLMLGAGALLVIDGELTPGAMIAANVLATRALAPIDLLVGAWRGFLGAKAAFSRLERLLLEHPQRDPALRRTAPQGHIQLKDVWTSAPGRADPILKGVNLTLQPGTVTVVMGPSGSGKSTLARVVLGVWPNVQGEVLLDGRPIQDWSRDALGPHIGYVPQDIELFDGTIAQNIARMGEEDSQKIIEAAQVTGLHPVVLRFPKGYDTPIGEAGHMLSGGQRQRLALARALYGRPPLVVLDEPNANLDDAGEHALQAALRAIKAHGSTVLVISHRPGVLAVADYVVIMQDGHIREAGPRDHVLQRVQQSRQVPIQNLQGPQQPAGAPA